jgi:S1-C subfamily serine protease
MSDHLAALSDAFSGLVAKTAASIVAIESRRTRASGFVWRPGLIAASEEMLSEDEEFSVVLHGGERVNASLAGRDPSTAIALLKTEATQAPQLALSAPDVSPGALVLAQGALGGAPLAAQTAIALAAGPWRSMRGGELTARIELDRPLRRALFGGVALDAHGNAFGMLVEGPKRRTLVIPTATIERIAPILRDKGRIARGYLGLSLQPAPVDGRRGAIVIAVDDNGPGARAGVRQGDVIVAVDGAPLESVRALLRTLRPDSVGRSLRLALRRGGEPLELEFAIAERPA